MIDKIYSTIEQALRMGDSGEAALRRQEDQQMLDRATELMDLGEYKQAALFFRRLSLRNPETPYYVQQLSIAYAQMGAGPLAAETAAKAMKMDTSSGLSHLCMGMAQEACGARRSARNWYIRAYALAPDKQMIKFNYDRGSLVWEAFKMKIRTMMNYLKPDRSMRSFHLYLGLFESLRRSAVEESLLRR